MAAKKRTLRLEFAIPGHCWQGNFLDADNNTFDIFEVDGDAK
jgi:hypothetical protein